jgi:hypothetical protein
LAGDPVALALTAGDAASRGVGAALFPHASVVSLARDDLRPSVPFDGQLFAILARQQRGACVGLVVPAVWLRTAEDEGLGVPGGRPALAAGDVVPIADHVGLELRGPLSGRWPAGAPREFPSMTGIYQPGLVRPREGARVYSSGVVAAGVADARRLTRFEARAVREGGWPIVSDCLVPAVIVAAYYGLRLAACGVLQAPRSDRE